MNRISDNKCNEIDNKTTKGCARRKKLSPGDVTAFRDGLMHKDE
jgi:hypothetical protein